MNQAQLEFLNSMLGEEGNYVSTILEYDGLDLGTKVLYLERSITQDQTSFLLSLDKLYRDGLPTTENEAIIAFLTSLKVINDLCFNHEVQFGEFGLKPALTHYFGRLGEENQLVPSEYETAIKELICRHIAKMSENKEDEIASQKQNRIGEEGNIQANNAWRTENLNPNINWDVLTRDLQFFTDRMLNDYIQIQLVFSEAMQRLDELRESEDTENFLKDMISLSKHFNSSLNTSSNIVQLVIEHQLILVLFNNTVDRETQQEESRVALHILYQLREYKRSFLEKYSDVLHNNRVLIIISEQKKAHSSRFLSAKISLALITMSWLEMLSALIITYVAMFNVFGLLLYGLGTIKFALGIGGLIDSVVEKEQPGFLDRDSFYISFLVISGFIAALSIAEVAICFAILLKGVELGLGIGAVCVIDGAAVTSLGVSSVAFFTRLKRPRAIEPQDANLDLEAGNANLALG